MDSMKEGLMVEMTDKSLVDLMVSCLVRMKVNYSVSKTAYRLVDPKAVLLRIDRKGKKRKMKSVKIREKNEN